MSKLTIILTVMFAGILAPATYASSLQDWEFNINGTTYYPSKGSSLASIPGLTQVGFNTTTGVGTYQIKTTAIGSDFIGVFFDVPVAIPFYNEYGAQNGVPVSGQSFEVGAPEYDVTSANQGSEKIVDDLANEKLSDLVSTAGSLSNYLNNCGANGGASANPACNDFVSLAMGFNFKLTAGETETVTFTLGTSNPGGFSVEDIHPVDGSNVSLQAIYLSGSAVLGSAPPPPPPPGVPEPASAGLAAAALGLLAFAKIRLSRKDGSR
jgi:hypothetical protein